MLYIVIQDNQFIRKKIKTILNTFLEGWGSVQQQEKLLSIILVF